jgi:hypothetical protein
MPIRGAALERYSSNLDAGEYAEARRIFCHGSLVCDDNDEGLGHHVKAWNRLSFKRKRVTCARNTDSAIENAEQ